jgi:hypothetical protein
LFKIADQHKTISERTDELPIKIKAIKARTLMLENQNSNSPKNRTPIRLMKKTG